jgi:hypothetical protein
MSNWRLTATCEHGVHYKVSPQQLGRGSLPPCTCKAEVEAMGRRGSWSKEWRTMRRLRRELKTL